MNLSETAHLPKGELELRLIDPVTGEVVKARHHKNLVLARATMLIAQLVGGTGAPALSHFALGSGVGSGTLQSPQAPDIAATQLRNEIKRVTISGVSFDDLGNARGDTITDGVRSNRLILAGTVGPINNPVGGGTSAITEAALFGNVGADNTNGGDMFNWVTFPVINKPDNLTLNFRWTLVFPVTR